MRNFFYRLYLATRDEDRDYSTSAFILSYFCFYALAVTNLPTSLTSATTFAFGVGGGLLMIAFILGQVAEMTVTSVLEYLLDGFMGKRIQAEREAEAERLTQIETAFPLTEARKLYYDLITPRDDENYTAWRRARNQSLTFGESLSKKRKHSRVERFIMALLGGIAVAFGLFLAVTLSPLTNGWSVVAFLVILLPILIDVYNLLQRKVTQL